MGPRAPEKNSDNPFTAWTALDSSFVAWVVWAMYAGTAQKQPRRQFTWKKQEDEGLKGKPWNFDADQYGLIKPILIKDGLTVDNTW